MSRHLNTYCVAGYLLI